MTKIQPLILLILFSFTGTIHSMEIDVKKPENIVYADIKIGFGCGLYMMPIRYAGELMCWLDYGDHGKNGFKLIYLNKFLKDNTIQPEELLIPVHVKIDKKKTSRNALEQSYECEDFLPCMQYLPLKYFLDLNENLKITIPCSTSKDGCPLIYRYTYDFSEASQSDIFHRVDIFYKDPHLCDYFEVPKHATDFSRNKNCLVKEGLAQTASCRFYDKGDLATRSPCQHLHHGPKSFVEKIKNENILKLYKQNLEQKKEFQKKQDESFYNNRFYFGLLSVLWIAYFCGAGEIFKSFTKIGAK